MERHAYRGGEVKNKRTAGSADPQPRAHHIQGLNDPLHDVLEHV
jgi:hypothetical protein